MVHTCANIALFPRGDNLQHRRRHYVRVGARLGLFQRLCPIPPPASAVRCPSFKQPLRIDVDKRPGPLPNKIRLRDDIHDRSHLPDFKPQLAQPDGQLQSNIPARRLSARQLFMTARTNSSIRAERGVTPPRRIVEVFMQNEHAARLQPRADLFEHTARVLHKSEEPTGTTPRQPLLPATPPGRPNNIRQIERGMTRPTPDVQDRLPDSNPARRAGIERASAARPDVAGPARDFLIVRAQNVFAILLRLFHMVLSNQRPNLKQMAGSYAQRTRTAPPISLNVEFK